MSDRGVARFVRGDGPSLAFGVRNGLGQAEFFCHARPLDVGPVHRRPAGVERPDQCFVQKMLEHYRRIPEGRPGQGVPFGGIVELGGMRLPSQVVVDDLAPAGAAGDVHPDGLVEAARAQ